MISPPKPERAALKFTHEIDCPPVDPTEIAESLGAYVGESYSADHLASFTSRDEPIVATNTRLSAQRRRFALAHAVGHLVMHRRDLVVCHVIRADDRPFATLAPLHEEAEAHQFALALLLPERWVRELIAVLRESNPPRERLIRDVAHSFDVTTSAVGARFYGLGVLTS